MDTINFSSFRKPFNSPPVGSQIVPGATTCGPIPEADDPPIGTYVLPP